MFLTRINKPIKQEIDFGEGMMYHRGSYFEDEKEHFPKKTPNKKKKGKNKSKSIKNKLHYDDNNTPIDILVGTSILTNQDVDLNMNTGISYDDSASSSSVGSCSTDFSSSCSDFSF